MITIIATATAAVVVAFIALVATLIHLDTRTTKNDEILNVAAVEVSATHRYNDENFTCFGRGYNKVNGIHTFQPVVSNV